MASSNTDSPGTIYRWIERKPLTEAVLWTSKEKFWLITSTCHYGTHDWKSVAQVLRHVGEPYRPREWYAPKNCEHQFKIVVSNLSKELKSLPFIDMLRHIAEGLRKDYLREVSKSKETLKLKYCNLYSILNRVKQGNLSRNEIVSLYSQARRNEVEGKQYLDQLMTKQNASLASENSSSGLIEEPIKWNTPSAPLLTSLLRSRNTIPANRTATTITSLLQSPGGTSRTRSGKLLPLTPSIRTTQGTPTLSKLLEAPANPYIPNPPQTAQKNKLSEVVTEKLANTSKKENSQSTSLNKVRVDNMTTLGSFNQINKSDLSASKKLITKSPVATVKNGSKSNLSVVNLLSDSENDDDKNTSLKSPFGEKKDTSSRVEPRATRSQTRAEGGFKQFNDTKLPDGKKERESLRQQSGGSQTNETHSINDDVTDIDQIEVEPLSSVQDEIQTQTPSKMTRSSSQKLRLLNPGDNLLTNNKVNNKEINNKMVEDISANFILNNSSSKTLATQYQCLLGEPKGNSSNVSESLLPVDRTAVKDAILIRKDSQSLQNTSNTSSDEKLLKQKEVFELKSSNIKSIDDINNSQMLSTNNQPMLVVNKIKKPFNIKPTSEQKVDDIQVIKTNVKKSMRYNNSSQNVVKLSENKYTVTATAAAAAADDDDDIVIVEDEININDNNKTTMKTKGLSSSTESQNSSSIVISPNISSDYKSNLPQLNEKKIKNDKTSWNVFGKPQNILDSTKKCQDSSVSKSKINSNISETNNRFIKELDFDFDQSISQTSLAELYNGVEEIVEMHSFDNEELSSLIECGPLNSNETEECRNIVSVDQGDSSVSESDSTIGAFDTFAQITRVQQKSSTSKYINLDTRESKKTNQEIKHLKENVCQSVKIDDNQSTAVSVTGIPILQGVISDVMNQIDLDGVPSLTTLNSNNSSSNDVVEIISSDEEVTVENIKAGPSNMQNKQIQTLDKEKEGKSYKIKEAESIKVVPEVESKLCKNNNSNSGISAIKSINVEMPPCIVVKNQISAADRMTFNKILEIKKESAVGYNQDNEMIYTSNPDEIIDLNEFNYDEDVEPTGIAVNIFNENLLKETEMKKEAEERKKKEEERLKQEYDERKKKENDDRMKKENEERMKKEEMKKREFEKRILNERKKKEDEERKIKEDEERKKKEENERKMRDLQETMKKEAERKLAEKYEAERQRKIIDDRISAYDLRLRNVLKQQMMGMEKRVVVKEEIIDECVECVDDIMEEIIYEEDTSDEDDGYVEDPYSEEIHSKVKKARSLKTILKRHKDVVQLRGNELQLKERCQKNLDQIRECLRVQDLVNKRENVKASTSENLVQKEYMKFDVLVTDNPNILKFKTVDIPQHKADELQTLKSIEIKRLTEAEIQKYTSSEKYKAHVIKSKKAKEVELRRVKEAELERANNERVRMNNELEAKKFKEAELRKNITVKENEMKGLEKRSVLKKVNEPVNNRSVAHTEINLVKNHGVVPPVQFKKKNEQEQKNRTNTEQALIETRKAATKEDFETFNPRERGVKKCVGFDGKNSKTIESKLPEVKMVTRTRGLRVEEKLKESNVSKNVSTKLRPQIKSSGSTSIASSTTVENLSIASNDNKKQTKNTDDGNKVCTTVHVPRGNDKNFKDLNIEPNVLIRQDNLNREVIDTPRTRTRSSSFKKKTISENKISKQSPNVSAHIQKETIGMKKVYNLHPEGDAAKQIIQNITSKRLYIPVVMLDTKDIPLHKVNQRSINLMKQRENALKQNQVQKPIGTKIQLEKTSPKKRGRKRKIDVQNEKLQKSKSNEVTSKNCRKTRISIKEVEPLARRTRRSLGLRNIKNESMNKQSVQSCKFKKELLDK
ncbi:stress response protein NST1-like [Melanaphis sacchari]|uniref:stress response protein NST1-like n=1 Tax=Melanaphis sacchari TaxID=742174 RepID=UPI000DC14CC0|nr:stress response protein NST1-like [Melanaphis sacchari]